MSNQSSLYKLKLIHHDIKRMGHTFFTDNMVRVGLDLDLTEVLGWGNIVVYSYSIDSSILKS